MFKCIYCGFASVSGAAIFCGECGPNGPASAWSPEDVDLNTKVSQYISLLSEYYFESHSDAEIEKLSMRMRERLKISHAKHVEILSKLSEQKKAVAHLSNFRFEFNENVTDAYAGHDTFLDFRYTNLSQDDAFKLSLLWDDPETTDRVDLRTETKSFVKPFASLTMGCSAVFDRIGIKEISDLLLTVTDQFGDTANFRVEPFRFKVGNPDARVVQHISTHNQISIEGRGVVDATGMGQHTEERQSMNSLPQWKTLCVNYIPNELNIGTVSSETFEMTSAVTEKKLEVFGEEPPVLTASLCPVIPYCEIELVTRVEDLHEIVEPKDSEVADEDPSDGDKFLDSEPTDGQGSWQYDGYSYVGSYKDGMFHGVGEIKWTGVNLGHKYVGNFVNGYRHGQGTYTFPSGETQVGNFENNEFIPDQYFNGNEELNSISEVVLYYANKKITALGTNFYVDNGPKFLKKIENFTQSFSKVHFQPFDSKTDAALLFYDGTILGSGKDGIVFTANGIYAKGCLGNSVKHVNISYSQIKSVRISAEGVRDKEIYLESSGHASLIVLNPIYAPLEDLFLIVEMLKKIQVHLQKKHI